MDELLNNKKSNRIFLVYTIIFAIICLIIFAIFIKYDKGFIWQSDGEKQHYAILYDFNQTVRNIFRNGFSMLSWNMGLGLDFIGQYSYYVIGDPFAYLSLLFPMESLETIYSVLIILRIFCLGLAFIAYCRYTNKESINTLIGAIIYAFCGFTIYAAIRHPYFTNAAILLPLNFIGIEKLLKENKKVFLTFIVFVTAINNYYFFYMITIVNIIYMCVKYFFEYNKGIKEFWKKSLNMAVSYIIGVLMAAVILFPTIYSFLNSSRSDWDIIRQFKLTFYKYFFIGIICMRHKNWTVISMASIIILMLPILITKFKKNEAKSYISLLVITTIMLVIPFTVSMMNGFSFPSNRWVFTYSFILSYIVTMCFDSKLKYTKNQKIFMLITLICYFIVGAWITDFKIKQNLDFYACSLIALLILTIISYKYKKEKSLKYANYSVIFLVIINIFVISFALYSTQGKGYVEQFIDNNSVDNRYATVNGKIQNYKEAIEYIKQNDKSFYRIGKTVTGYQNLSVIFDYNPIETYVSLGNGYVYDLSCGLEDRCYTATRCVNSADRRTKFTTLLGNKYYICDKENSNYIPYGYRLYHQIDDTHIYINDNALSVGILYDNYITLEEFKELSPLQKEDALLSTVVIENDVNNIRKEENIKEKTVLPIELKYKVQDDMIENNSIKTIKKNQEVILNIEGIIPDTELYLSIKNLKYETKSQDTDFKLTATFNGIKSSEEVLDCVSSPYYMCNPNFLINLGITKREQSNELKIKFDNKGIYTFDKLEILAVPMEDYTAKVNQLKQMTNIQYGSDIISGEISTDTKGILQLTTSYSDGWKAYVDNKEVELLKVNEAFIGCEVESGNHKIRFEYETPYLKLGIITSIIGTLGYIAIIVLEKRKISKNFRSE